MAKIVDGLYENSKSLCDASYLCQKYKMEGTNQELVELYERSLDDLYRNNASFYCKSLKSFTRSFFCPKYFILNSLTALQFQLEILSHLVIIKNVCR